MELAPDASKITGLKLSSKNRNLKKQLSRLKEKKVMRIKSFKNPKSPNICMEPIESFNI
jgi:hypothetical protein